jgi:hypothetical protein
MNIQHAWRSLLAWPAWRRAARIAVMAAMGLGCASLPAAVLAHHSYAMFDATRTVTVSGTVAKFEWANPHVFVWVYVPNPKTSGGYDLYAFENGSTNVLTRLGWSRTTLQPNEKVSIEYAPLKDGRTGGHLLKVTYADGRVINGAGGPGSAQDRVTP